MADKPATVDQYLDALEPDRREAVEAIRRVINDNLDPAFAEGVQYGMPAWFLPHDVYPHGYHCDPTQPLPFVSVASQKKHISIYLLGVYVDAGEKQRLVDAWQATGRRPDMGAGCVRVRKLEDVPLDVLGAAIKRMTADRFVAAYEAGLPNSVKRKRGGGEA
jgi:hypothetical protein